MADITPIVSGPMRIVIHTLERSPVEGYKTFEEIAKIASPGCFHPIPISELHHGGKLIYNKLDGLKHKGDVCMLWVAVGKKRSQTFFGMDSTYEQWAPAARSVYGSLYNF